MHLSDVGLSQKEHGYAGLTDAAADGQGKLSVQKHSVIRECSALVAAGKTQLAVHRLRIHADSHGRDLHGAVQNIVIEEDVPVEVPVVIVRGTSVMALSGAELAADAHDKGGAVFLDPGVLPLFRRQIGIEILQFLGGHEGDISLKFAEHLQLGVD